ncbi:MAG: aldolase/citrate lyase family protein [Oscillospiraceae bacterium]|nr:aldolase/citrate lyase family protein [Oscillospiraceae bacterium]
MRENVLKKKMKCGESAIGTFVKLIDPAVVELLALAGFDFFVLDTEHVAVDREQLTNIVRAADAAGITPLVRVRENQQVEILQNLDLGYAGVQVPNVDTAQQARELVSYVKYTPAGVRGLSPSVRACGYGTCGVQDYIDAANANTMVVSHCETKTCVENLDEVLQVEGVDVIFIGPMDLSQSYGVPGRPGEPEVRQAIETIKRKTKAAGIAVGTVAGSAEAAKKLIAEGVQYILLASDQGMIVKWGKSAIAAIRG